MRFRGAIGVPDGPIPAHMNVTPTTRRAATRRLGVVALGALLAAVAGCALRSSDPPPSIEEFKTTQHDLGVAIGPFSSRVMRMDVRAPVPAKTPAKLRPLLVDLADGVNAWLVTSHAWALPAHAKDGIPSRTTVDAYDTAMKPWAEAQQQLLGVLAECAGTNESMLDCLHRHGSVYERWKDVTAQLADAERAMIVEAALSL